MLNWSHNLTVTDRVRYQEGNPWPAWTSLKRQQGDTCRQCLPKVTCAVPSSIQHVSLHLISIREEFLVPFHGIHGAHTCTLVSVGMQAWLISPNLAAQLWLRDLWLFGFAFQWLWRNLDFDVDASFSDSRSVVRQITHLCLPSSLHIKAVVLSSPHVPPSPIAPPGVFSVKDTRGILGGFECWGHPEWIYSPLCKKQAICAKGDTPLLGAQLCTKRYRLWHTPGTPQVSRAPSSALLEWSHKQLSTHSHRPFFRLAQQFPFVYNCYFFAILINPSDFISRTLELMAVR